MKRFWIKFLLGAALILLIGVALKPEYKVSTSLGSQAEIIQEQRLVWL